MVLGFRVEQIIINFPNVAASVNILGGLGGFIHRTFWLIHWKFVDYPWARVVIYENHVLARKIGSLRVALYKKTHL